MDKLAPVRSMFELLTNNCKKLRILCEYETIDEKYKSFRDRCLFRQCIPNKTSKYSIKMFALCT